MADELVEKLFPKKWSGITLSADDVQYHLVNDCKILIPMTKSVLGKSHWSANKLKNLITTKGKLINEDWNFPKNSKILLVWQKGYLLSDPPDAFMSFNFSIVERTKTNKASSIVLDNHLMWVTPKQRGKGIGYHLIAHFIHYLNSCKTHYPLVSKLGIDLTYYADYYSIGGESLSHYIYDHLEYMREWWNLTHDKSVWPIRKLEIDAGF